jgi:hypothetical protein
MFPAGELPRWATWRALRYGTALASPDTAAASETQVNYDAKQATNINVIRTSPVSASAIATRRGLRARSAILLLYGCGNISM